jgi:hypothetical protein
LAHIIEMTMEFSESFGRFEDFPQTEWGRNPIVQINNLWTQIVQNLFESNIPVDFLGTPILSLGVRSNDWNSLHVRGPWSSAACNINHTINELDIGLVVYVNVCNSFIYGRFSTGYCLIGVVDQTIPSFHIWSI